MLRITIPANGKYSLTFSSFESLDLPKPLNGVDVEVNNDLILQFVDEEDAIRYAERIESLALELNDKTSIRNIAIGEIIAAIRNDDFVKAYTEDN